jgi:hypothetical protein
VQNNRSKKLNINFGKNFAVACKSGGQQLSPISFGEIFGLIKSL